MQGNQKRWLATPLDCPVFVGDATTVGRDDCFLGFARRKMNRAVASEKEKADNRVFSTRVSAGSDGNRSGTGQEDRRWPAEKETSPRNSHDADLVGRAKEIQWEVLPFRPIGAVVPNLSLWLVSREHVTSAPGDILEAGAGGVQFTARYRKRAAFASYVCVVDHRPQRPFAL
jgi:hypothetical protein